MLEARHPGQKLLFAEHHTTAELVEGKLLAPCEFANETFTDIQKLCCFADLVEPFVGVFSWSWLTLRLWGCVPYLRIKEVSLD